MLFRSETSLTSNRKRNERKAHKCVSFSHYLVSPNKLSYFLCHKCFDKFAAFKLLIWFTISGCSLHVHYQVSFLEPKLSQHFLEAMTVTPNIDLISQSRPWHLNWPLGKQWINKDDKRERAVRSGPLFEKGSEVLQRRADGMLHRQSPLVSALRGCLSRTEPCQRGCDNHGHSSISVLQI